jgi:hypothetical protein
MRIDARIFELGIKKSRYSAASVFLLKKIGMCFALINTTSPIQLLKQHLFEGSPAKVALPIIFLVNNGAFA